MRRELLSWILELKNCRAKVYKEGNVIYLMIICGKRKEKITKCIKVEVGEKSIVTGDNRARVELPVETDPEIVLKAVQTVGDWFAQRLNEERGRIGYLSEMIVKYAVYFLCKEKKKNGMKLTKCLKETNLVTSRGKVSWKAIYQLFSNTKDLPRELHEPQYWAEELPTECIQTKNASSKEASDASTQRQSL